MTDYIERQAAIDAVHEEFDDVCVWDESGETTANEVERILDYLPSAQPERKRGEWIEEPGKIPRCSNCGIYSDDADKGYDKYCPNCGARMRGKG